MRFCHILIQLILTTAVKALFCKLDLNSTQAVKLKTELKPLNHFSETLIQHQSEHTLSLNVKHSIKFNLGLILNLRTIE